MARGMQLTIDEWFYHWFSEEDSTKLQSVTIFFRQLLEVCDMVVLQRGSRLAKKFHALAEKSVAYPPQDRAAVKLLIGNFYRSEKIKIVDNVLPLPDDIVSRLPRKDIYLVQICLETKEKIIITTDTTLYQNLLDTKSVLEITPYMAADFIDSYPQFWEC